LQLTVAAMRQACGRRKRKRRFTSLVERDERRALSESARSTGANPQYDSALGAHPLRLWRQQRQRHYAFFRRHTAVQEFSDSWKDLANIKIDSHKDSMTRIGLLLAYRASEKKELRKFIPNFLADTDEDVRFLAVKWIADQRLLEHRSLLTELLKNPKLSVRMFLGCTTALSRLDGKEVNDAALADFFAERIADERSSPELRVKALQLAPLTHPKLTVDFLAKLVEHKDSDLRLEAARALAEHPSPKRREALVAVMTNDRQPTAARAQAIAGLADFAEEIRKDLLSVDLTEPVLRDEALRALMGAKLSVAQRNTLDMWSLRYPASAPLVARVLGQPHAKDRPKADDTTAWLSRLEGRADPETGRRIFFNHRLGGCARCHRIDGRGQDLGPDLSTVGHNDRRRILESILQPNALVPPRYQAWILELNDGRVLTGMLVKTYLDEYTYLDEKGNQFKVKTGDIVETRPAPASIMPAGLVDGLTDQELRDLLAYLQSRR